MYLLLLAKKKCVIDDPSFRLHYRYTSTLLVLFAVLIGIKQMFGDPIHCSTNVNGVPSPFLDNYCSHNHGKWTVFELNHTGVLHEVPYPDDEGIDDQTTHWHRSDWFPILLLLSAGCFYVPRCLWERWEGGSMENICGDMFLCKDKERVTMLLECVTKKWTRNYFAKYVFCEGLNGFNLFLQLFLMDCFFHGDLLFHPQPSDDFMNVMQRVFPTWIKCSTVEHGDQNLEGVCNLPINTINQNIFGLLMVWSIYLIVITTVASVERNLSMISQWARSRILLRQGHGLAWAVLCRSERAILVRAVCERLTPSQWFVLLQIGRNVHGDTFTRLMAEIVRNHVHKMTQTPEDWVLP